MGEGITRLKLKLSSFVDAKTRHGFYQVSRVLAMVCFLLVAAIFWAACILEPEDATSSRVIVALLYRNIGYIIAVLGITAVLVALWIYRSAEGIQKLQQALCYTWCWIMLAIAIVCARGYGLQVENALLFEVGSLISFGGGAILLESCRDRSGLAQEDGETEN